MENNITKLAGPQKLDKDTSIRIALYYMKTLVAVAKEPFLIIDADFRVILANKGFYETFHVVQKETEGRFIYELGNGQWDIPGLMKLLKEILPTAKSVKNYEVVHDFEMIGKKTMLLNARQIDMVELIILSIEDITDRKNSDNKLIEYTEWLEDKIIELAKGDNKPLKKIAEFKKEIGTLEKKIAIRK